MEKQNSVGMRSVNVQLEYTNPNGEVVAFDINSQGLVGMTFKRYLGETTDARSGVLSNMDITMFDKTGYKLLSMFQASEGRLRIRYGFEDDMSETYDLSILKYKSTYNNMGVMSSIGAIGTASFINYGPEIYKQDTRVEDILIRMATRNNWNISPLEDHIDVGDIKIPSPMNLEPDESDADFIYNKILPICNRTVVSASSSETEFWDLSLFKTPSGRVDFYFRRYSDKTASRRVWRYTYGMANNSKVIDFTNTIDYTFLIRGLSIKVPAKATEYMGVTDEVLNEQYTDLVVNRWDRVQEMFLDLNLPAPKVDEFALKVEFIPMEEADEEDIEERIFKEIRKAVMAINSIELQVIGNHKIRPIDIIDLQVRDRDGIANIVSGLWKVVTIEESIGAQGFTTKLGLVRETADIILND